jgi:hypothetical protein
MEPQKSLDETDVKEQVIKLNVGGTLFETYKTTLQHYPYTLLGSMFTSSKEITTDKTEFFFDRDPTLFPMILNYYRNGFVVYPENIHHKITEAELTFWQIPLLETPEAFNITGQYLVALSKSGEKENKEMEIYDEQITYLEREKSRLQQFLTGKEKSGEIVIKNDSFLESVKELDRGIKMCEEKMKSLQGVETKKRDQYIDVIDKLNLTLKQQIDHLETQRRIMRSLSEALCIDHGSPIVFPHNWMTYNDKRRYEYFRSYGAKTRKHLCLKDCIFIPFSKMKNGDKKNKDNFQIIDVQNIKPPYDKDYDFWTNIVGKNKCILYYVKYNKPYLDTIDSLYTCLITHDILQLCTPASYMNLYILEVYWGEKSAREQLKELIEQKDPKMDIRKKESKSKITDSDYDTEELSPTLELGTPILRRERSSSIIRRRSPIRRSRSRSISYKRNRSGSRTRSRSK